MNNIDKTLYEDITYGTNIITGKEYLDTIMTIADVASDMVVKTLGPYGKTTIIDDGTFTYPTKDGWSVLKRLRFNDPIYNTLYKVLQQVSFELVNRVGDGTTSSFVGATIFMHKIIDYMNEHEDFRQADFLNALNEVTDTIINTLKSSKYVKKIDITKDFSDIYKIADVASNGNHELSKMIQEIYQKTQNPNIYVTLDSGHKSFAEIQTGYKLDCNPVNQKKYRNTDEGTYTLNERSMIAIFDHNVNYTEHQYIISGLSRYAQAHKCTVFILAPHFDDIISGIIGTSIDRLLQNGQIPNIMMVQVPLSGATIQKKYLSDMVLLTNAQLFGYGKVRAFNVLANNEKAVSEEDKIEDALLQVDNYNFTTPEEVISSCVGYANKVVVGENYFLIQDYETIVNETVYRNTLEDVEKEYLTLKEKANKSTTILHKEYMDAYQHYIKLFGKMGIIHVGGTSELEKHCTKDTVDDAVLACRSAFDNGYIRGLNLTTLTIMGELSDEFSEDTLKYAIASMLYDTFFEMSLKVLNNKYSDSIVRKVTVIHPSETEVLNEMTNTSILNYALQNQMEYNLVNDTMRSDKDAMIVNSVSTDVEILRGIVSILSTMLTSNQFLSINRNFDRNMGRQQQMQTKIEYHNQLARAITTSVVDILTEKGILPLDISIEEECIEEDAD